LVEPDRAAGPTPYDPLRLCIFATVALLGWLGAAALWTAGATGWLAAVALAAAVVMLQFQRLTPDERRWVLARVRRPAAEAVR